jgi:hypothetical protein
MKMSPIGKKSLAAVAVMLALGVASQASAQPVSTVTGPKQMGAIDYSQCNAAPSSVNVGSRAYFEEVARGDVIYAGFHNKIVNPGRSNEYKATVTHFYGDMVYSSSECIFGRWVSTQAGCEIIEYKKKNPDGSTRTFAAGFEGLHPYAGPDCPIHDPAHPANLGTLEICNGVTTAAYFYPCDRSGSYIETVIAGPQPTYDCTEADAKRFFLETYGISN